MLTGAADLSKQGFLYFLREPPSWCVEESKECLQSICKDEQGSNAETKKKRGLRFVLELGLQAHMNLATGAEQLNDHLALS